MRRHPARHPHADRRDLPRPARPAGGIQTPVSPSIVRRLELEGGEGLDDRALEIPDVPLHVLPVPRQVEDRVADELAGGMVGRLAAAVRLDELDVGPGRDVELLLLLGAPAGRDTGGCSTSTTVSRDRALGDTAAASERCSSSASP